MKKRILSVLLCGILLANLAGCAGKSQSASDVSDESAFQAEQIGKTEAAAQTAAPENKPEPAPSEPVAQEPEPAQTEPAFDIGYWVSYAKSYAQGVGLVLDSGAVYCWDNPITAGSHCIYLERDITNRLNRYSNDGSITQVWVWAEDRGDGSYDLYIGYA